MGSHVCRAAHQPAALNAVLAIYGTTQSGKSTIAHLAFIHFGSGFIQGRDYHAPIDWTSTVTALEAAMFLAKDIPLVIDDFAPQFSSVSDARSMHKKAEYVVRSAGNLGRAWPLSFRPVTANHALSTRYGNHNF